MNKKKIWLSSPHMGGNEQQFVQQVFDTNSFAPFGDNVVELEKQLERFLENDSKVTLLSSGTAAIHMALILLDVKSNDEVICQSMTFCASVNPIIYLGATPIFVDSEKETYNLCPIALENAIKDRIKNGKKPKAIIAVQLFGIPYKVKEIHAVSKKYKIPVIEDSAEALGSSFGNQKCGTFGDFGILSFNSNKIITTSSGGAIICKNEKLKNKIEFLASQAKDAAPHYQHSQIGYNYSMNNLCAGIGLGQMKVLENRIETRRKMQQFYSIIFTDIKGVTVYKVPNSDYFANYWLTTVIIDPTKTNGKTREDLRLYLETQNIESRPLWKPMHLQPVFEKYPYYGTDVAADLFENGLCLPSGSNLDANDRVRIAQAIQVFFTA